MFVVLIILTFLATTFAVLYLRTRADNRLRNRARKLERKLHIAWDELNTAREEIAELETRVRETSDLEAQVREISRQRDAAYSNLNMLLEEQDKGQVVKLKEKTKG